jgi:hypothetical protein
MRTYDYYTIGEKDEYGQQDVNFDTPKGTIKIAIYVTSQAVQDNIRYIDAAYMGLTLDKNVNNNYVIQYGDERLKVLYVNTQGRFKQVFLKNI